MMLHRAERAQEEQQTEKQFQEAKVLRERQTAAMAAKSKLLQPDDVHHDFSNPQTVRDWGVLVGK